MGIIVGMTMGMTVAGRVEINAAGGCVARLQDCEALPAVPLLPFVPLYNLTLRKYLDFYSVVLLLRSQFLPVTKCHHPACYVGDYEEQGRTSPIGALIDALAPDLHLFGLVFHR